MDVLVLAITISRSSTVVVNVVRGRAIAKFLIFVLGGDAGLAQATREEFREGEFFILPHDLIAFELGLSLVE